MSDLLAKLDYAIGQLAKSSDFAKARFQTQVLDIASRVIAEPSNTSYPSRPGGS